jgi:hypothetical protein
VRPDASQEACCALPPGSARPAAKLKPMPSRAGDTAARGECCNPATPRPVVASKLRDPRDQVAPVFGVGDALSLTEPA